MKVALCCIGRMENQYAREFVSHYVSLGVNKIFIYDNNHEGEEHFDEVIDDYIFSGLVEIIDYRGIEDGQKRAYNECYEKHKNEYDWFLFFDFDEFLVLENTNSISTYLSKFKVQQCVLVNWMIMDDNNLIFNDKRPLSMRFTTPMEMDKCVSYDFPENYHVKSIIRGGLEGVRFTTTPHVPTEPQELICCDAVGKPCSLSPFKKYVYSGAYLKHYQTKTIEEWMTNKRKRGYPDGNKDWFEKNDVVEHFFKINEEDDNKKAYVASLNNDLKIFVCTHKDFDCKLASSVYEIVTSKFLRKRYGLKVHQCRDMRMPVDEKFYAELYMYKYVHDKLELPKYVGFCHYRKFFGFLNQIPNMDEIFSEYDCIVAKPLVSKKNMAQQYAITCNIDDVAIMGKIIKEKYPEYIDGYNKFFTGNVLMMANMFIMKREDFYKWYDFVMGVIDEYLKVVGTDIRKRIEDNKDKYLKDFYPNNTIEYQYRIGGFLAERLTNIFMLAHFKKLKPFQYILTENKYGKTTEPVEITKIEDNKEKEVTE